MRSIDVTRRELIAGTGLVALTALGSTGCIGGFNLTRMIYKANLDLHPNKFVQWVVFLVLLILPVYAILVFVDLWVLNSIEFWTGSNPVHAKNLGNGQRLVMTRTNPTRARVEHFDGEKLVKRFDLERVGDAGFRLLDTNGSEVAVVRSSGRGISLTGPDGHVATLDQDQLDLVARHLDDGASPSTAVQDALVRTRQLRKVSALSDQLRTRFVL